MAHFGHQGVSDHTLAGLDARFVGGTSGGTLMQVTTEMACFPRESPQSRTAALPAVTTPAEPTGATPH